MGFLVFVIIAYIRVFFRTGHRPTLEDRPTQLEIDFVGYLKFLKKDGYVDFVG